MERLASKAVRNIYTDQTDRTHNTLVGDATGRKAYDIATGKRKPDLKPKNVMVTMILFREKRRTQRRSSKRRNKQEKSR